MRENPNEDYSCKRTAPERRCSKTKRESDKRCLNDERKKVRNAETQDDLKGNTQDESREHGAFPMEENGAQRALLEKSVQIQN